MAAHKKYQQSTILNRIRFMTGKNISEWSSSLDVNRTIVYQSLQGYGKRRIRVLLAMFAGKLPSELWPDRSDKVKLIDDFAYIDALTFSLRELDN